MWNKKGVIFDDHHSQLPVIDEYDDFYRIYYSTRIEGKSNPYYVDVDKNNPKKILKKSEFPLLKLGNKGLFDWAGIMPTKIITIGKKKYLYYIGWSLRVDVPYHNNLGMATSDDNGETWVKYSDGPIFHTSHKEPGYIGTVDIIIEDDLWKMWYLSCREWIEYDGIMEPIYDIKYATSKNGIDWDPQNVTCISLENNEGGVSSARVIKEMGTYFMWFSIRDKFNYRDDINHSYRIKTAKSYDGINWVREIDTDLDISKDEWEDKMVCYPYVVKFNDKYYMFYNGNGFGGTGIGYATRERIF